MHATWLFSLLLHLLDLCILSFSSGESLGECGICLDQIDVNPSFPLPCKHVFHRDCLKTWVAGFSNSSPMCRSQILPSLHHHQSNPQPQVDHGEPMFPFAYGLTTTEDSLESVASPASTPHFDGHEGQRLSLVQRYRLQQSHDRTQQNQD